MDVEGVIDRLKDVASLLSLDNQEISECNVRAAIDYIEAAEAEKTAIERQAAEIARLNAEIERLTPKEMGMNEIVDALNRFAVFGCADWYAHPAGLFCAIHDLGDSLPMPEARYIAQGMLRDGGKGGGA